MSKDDRQARYERAWRRTHRTGRRFKRAPRQYWQPKPYKTPRWLRRVEAR